MAKSFLEYCSDSDHRPPIASKNITHFILLAGHQNFIHELDKGKGMKRV